jgi:toxin ParE1/3/4
VRQFVVLPDARADIAGIIRFIAADNPLAAQRVEARIYEAIESLAFMPIGREGRIKGTLEKLVKGLPYIIAFDVPDKTTLHVLRVIHGARDWQAGQWPD